MEDSHNSNLTSKLLQSQPSIDPQTKQEGTEVSDQTIYQRYRDAVSALPTAQGWLNPLRRLDGWFGVEPVLVGTMAAQHHFHARPTDILVASIPKSGVTWLKSLLFATVNRHSRPDPYHQLAALSPHELVPFLEAQLYSNGRIPDLGSLPDPRLFATHIPFGSLPASVVESGCKIVYICRDPKDTLVSSLHMANRFRVRAGLEPVSVEAGLDRFCDGIVPFGPYWDHLLGYRKAHLQGADKVLFLMYEDLVEDTKGQLKRLAEFVGSPFTAGEEAGGVVDAIVRFCGFDSLSNLEVNKAGKVQMVNVEIDNSMFFRKGGVGDWVTHLTPQMARRVEEITERKFRGSGLSFL